MTPLWCPILPGELFWSALARQVALFGINAPVTQHLQLVGNKRSLGSPLFPRQIDLLAKRLQLPQTPHEIIERHTMLPLYASFLRPTKVQRAAENMRGNGHAEFSLGLAPMEDYPSFLKVCPECIEEDLARHGWELWRIAHQAPGSLLCNEHGCALEVTTASARVGTQIAHFVTAGEASRPTAPRLPSACVADARWLAEAIVTLLQTWQTAPEPERLTALYRQTLLERDLLTKFDRLRLTELVEQFSRRFSQLLPLVGCRSPDPAARDNWLARLVRYPNCEQSPLKHLLLLRFLGMEVATAFTEAAHMHPLQRTSSKPIRGMRFSTRITRRKVADKCKQWLALRASHQSGSLRERNDALYCWLWRNARPWLRIHARRSHR